MEQSKHKVLSKEDTFSGHWLNLHQVKVKLRNGKTTEWEYVSRPKHLQNENGAMIIPIIKNHKQNSVIMIANYRPAVDNYCLEFPGGMADKGESVEDCVRR